MYRSLLPPKRWHALIAAPVLLMLLCCAVMTTSAQKKKKPSPSQGGAGAPATQNGPQSQKKNITPLRSSDSPQGSRVTITSDVPLNDYYAYRGGDRYYVVIPEASAPRAQSMRGRGFEDVQVQKRGNDAVLSFRLPPGTSAHVNQKFNKLDVVFDVPGKPSSTSAATNSNNNVSRPATSSSSNSSTNTRQTRNTTAQAATSPSNMANTGASGQANNAASGRNQAGNSALTAGTPSNSGTNGQGESTITPTTNVLTASTPSPAVSPAASASPLENTSPAQNATPEQVAQSQAAPTIPSAVTSGQPATGASLGTVLVRNLPWLLLAGLLLLSMALLVAARSKARKTAPPPPVIGGNERAEKLVAKEVPPPPVEAAAIPAAEQALTTAMVAPTQLPEEALVVESAPAVAEAETAAIEPESSSPAETAFDFESVETEVNHVLLGEHYDEAVVGSSDENVRQLVATGLLSALAGRNVERRERARAAYIQHGYVDDATRDLRAAHAPAERASAARNLGLVGEQTATPHLIAALEDKMPEVRRAAVEALAALHDSAAIKPLKDLLEREKQFKKNKRVDSALIKRAIEASIIVEDEETPTLAAATPAPEAVESPETSPAVTGVVEPSAIETPSEPGAVKAQAVEVESPVAPAEHLSTEVASEPVEATALHDVEAHPAIAEEIHTHGAMEVLPLVAAGAAIVAATQEAIPTKEEEEARKRFEEEERARVEEEARQRAEAEIARREAAEKAARQRAEEEAHARAEEEAARQRAEAARRRAEEERHRVEEEARVRAEAEARQRAEEAARRQAQEAARQLAEARRVAEEEQRAEAEARRAAEEQSARERAEEAARVRAAEEARLREEEEARLRAQEEEAARLRAEHEAAAPSAPFEMHEPSAAETTSFVAPVEPLIERNEASASDWFEVDISEVPEELAHPATEHAVPPFVYEAEAAIVESPSAVESGEHFDQQATAPEAFATGPVEREIAEAAPRELELAVTEKGLDLAEEEFTGVPNSILRRLGSEVASVRASAVSDLARIGGEDAFREIASAFDDPVQIVRDAAARALYNIATDRAASFTRALREAPAERRRNIGAALSSSGLAGEAISNLMGESREKTYDAFSLLFLMSKAGEVRPLMRAIEEHPNNEVRLAVVKLLALSGQQEILPAFRRLAVRGSLPTEVRSAVMEAIYQLSSQTSNDTSSVA